MSIGNVPESLTSLFKKNSDFHSYSTRLANLYHVPPVKLDLSKTGITYRGATIWNLIALEEINLEVSEAVFKKKIWSEWLTVVFFKCAVPCRLTISRSLWHVRQFVIMHIIIYICNNCGAHKLRWVYRSFCYTNLCFKVNAISISFCILHYVYMWNVVLVLRMAINLILFNLIWFVYIHNIIWGLAVAHMVIYFRSCVHLVGL